MSTRMNRIKRMSERVLSVSILAVCILTLGLVGMLRPHVVLGQEDSDSFSFSGDSTSISFSEDSRRTILSGNARITSDDMTIHAAVIELFGEDFRYARCRGDVQVENDLQKISLSTDSLFYDRDRDFLQIRDYVEMVDLENEIVIKCGYLEYYNESDLSIFQIGVRILKAAEEGQMVCRSDFARYDRQADTLQLSGDPVVYWKGDRYRAVSITINLETEEITLEGDVEGEFTTKHEQEE